MTSIRRAVIAAVVFAVGGLAACGPPPKVLVDQAYLGNERTTKVLMQRNGEQFNQLIRVCNLGPDGSEVACKDTLVLENVVPSSIY